MANYTHFEDKFERLGSKTFRRNLFNVSASFSGSSSCQTTFRSGAMIRWDRYRPSVVWQPEELQKLRRVWKWRGKVKKAPTEGCFLGSDKLKFVLTMSVVRRTEDPWLHKPHEWHQPETLHSGAGDRNSAQIRILRKIGTGKSKLGACWNLNSTKQG